MIYMKKFKAYIHQFWYCLVYLLNFEFNHRELREGISYQIFGKEIWFTAHKIGCTCGKIFYKK